MVKTIKFNSEKGISEINFEHLQFSSRSAFYSDHEPVVEFLISFKEKWDSDDKMLKIIPKEKQTMIDDRIYSDYQNIVDFLNDEDVCEYTISDYYIGIVCSSEEYYKKYNKSKKSKTTKHKQCIFKRFLKLFKNNENY